MAHHLRRIVTFAAVLMTTTAFAADTQDSRTNRRSPRAPRDRARAVILPDTGPATRTLTKLESCDQVRNHLVDVLVEMVIRNRYYWNAFPLYGPEDGAGGGNGPSDFTSTNNQESGVDELDIVKTDGEHLYVTTDNSLEIVRSWPAHETDRVGGLTLEGWPRGLLLHQDLALVVSTGWGMGVLDVAPHYRSSTRLVLVDVSDPGDPVVIRTLEIDGEMVGARLIDGQLYVVTWSQLDVPSQVWDLTWRDDLGLPNLSRDADDVEREAAMSVARQILRPIVAAIMQKIELTEVLPNVTDSSPSDPVGTTSALLTCDAVFKPTDSKSLAALSVSHLDLTAEDLTTTPLEATGILADGWTVYASTTSLYVAQTSWWWGWWGWGGHDMTTVIHKFELGGQEPVAYSATGEVDGWLLDQFGMGEFEDHLRVATTATDWWWGGVDDSEQRGSTVTVLADDGHGKMTTTGEVTGIAPGERIYASRFMGDRGYLVTFRQIDPLFTLDLSDPSNPQVMGELEVTGFSSYLHPMDDDHLLAVGMEADEEGRVLGLSVSVFDVGDMTSPQLDHRYTVEAEEGTWSWSEALWDHHAFTFHRGILSIPAYISLQHQRGFSGLIVLEVDADAGIAESARIDHSNLVTGAGIGPGAFARMRRSVYIEDYLYSISNLGIKVNELYHPTNEITSVVFENSNGDP